MVPVVALAPNSITCTVVPCGGVVSIDLVSSDVGPWTLTRTNGSVNYLLYSGPPLALPDSAPYYLDLGDGLNGPLVQTIAYTYTFTTPNMGAVSQTVTPASSIVLEYDDYLRLLVNVIEAGVNSLALTGTMALWKKPSVVISMPLVGQPTIPAISVNEDLLQMEEVPIGHGINTDTYQNLYQIQEIVNHRYRVTVLTTSTDERDFWKLAVISLFKSILVPVLVKMGQDVRSSFQAASSQIMDPPPGFYFCDIMLDFSGILPVRIVTSYPAATSYSLALNDAVIAEYGVFLDNNGVLTLSDTLNYPTSSVGLIAGNVWSNSLIVSVVSGVTPDPSAPPVLFGNVSPGDLLALGGGNLPLTDPGVTLQLWNNSGTVNISLAVSHFANDGGILQLLPNSGYPVSPVGLAAGDVWFDGGWIAVVPGNAPNPSSPPVFFGGVSVAGLQVLGGGNLPLTDPRVMLQLWNNGGIISISLGM